MIITNLLHNISLRHIRHQKMQTLLSVLGICIGVSAIVSIGIVNENIFDSFVNTIHYSMGRAALQITGAASGFPENIVDRVREVSGVEYAVPAIEATGTLRGAHEKTIMVLGVDMLEDQMIRDYKLSDEDAEIPDPLLFLAKADSILLTKELADLEKINIDQQIRVETPEGAIPVKVRGLLRPEGPAKAMAGNMAVMDIFAAQKAFGKEGRIDRIDVSLLSGADVDIVKKDIQAALPKGYNVETAAGRTKQVQTMLSRFQKTLGLARFIVIFVGMYIIYNSVSIAVVRRKKEIGVLRALGATKADVVLLFLFEMLTIGAFSSALGAGLGILQAKGSIGAITSLVSQVFKNTAIAEIHVTWSHITLGIFSGLTASLFAALFPSFSSSGITPISAIRSAPFSEELFLKNKKIAVLSALSLILSASLLLLYKAVPATSIFHSMIVVFISCMLLLGGISLAMPYFLKIFLQLFRRTAPLLGPAGRLAGLNLRKNIIRNAVAASAVFFGISMYVNSAGFTGSIEKSIMKTIDASMKADIIVTAGRPISTAGLKGTLMPYRVMDEIDAIPGVLSTDPFRKMYIDYENSRLLLMSMDMKKRLAYSDLFIIQGSREEIQRRLPKEDGIVVNEGFAQKHDVAPGDVIALSTPKGPVDFTVVAIMEEESSDSGSAFIDISAYQRHWGDKIIDFVSVRTTSKDMIPGVIAAIEKKLGAERKIFALPLEEWRNELHKILDDSFGFNRAISFLTLTIACFGIVVTLFASVLERTRELGVLRSIGMLKNQVFRVVLIESMILGFVGGVMGCLGGAIIGWATFEGFWRMDFGRSIPYIMPYSTMGPALLLSVIIAALSGIYPAWRAAKTNIVESLAYE